MNKRTFVSRDCNYYDTVVEEEDRGSIFTDLRVGSLTQDAAILQQADKNLYKTVLIQLFLESLSFELCYQCYHLAAGH